MYLTFKTLDGNLFVISAAAFDDKSEHVNLCSSESHVSVDTALDLCTGEYVRMY